MNDIRCMHLAAPVPVREVEGDHVDARERARERGDGGLVRAVADPDEQRPLVEPERVAALDEHRRRRASPTIGNAGGVERPARAPPARCGAPPCPAGGAPRPRSRRAPGRRRRSRPGCPGRGARRRPRRPPPRAGRRSASCSAAAAAWSGAARQPYSRQRSASSASGGRTSTRSSVPVIDAAPKRGIARDATPRSAGCAPRGARRAAPKRRASPSRGARHASRSRCAA